MLHVAGWKCRTQKNRQKFPVCAPSHNFVELYFRNQGMYRQPEKNLILHRRHLTEVNHQTLHYVWPCPGLVQYIYIFEALAPLTEFCVYKIYFASKSCLLIYWQRYCTVLEQWASGKHCGVLQKAPPIFVRAAITLGIGPHSSWLLSLPYKP